MISSFGSVGKSDISMDMCLHPTMYNASIGYINTINYQILSSIVI